MRSTRTQPRYPNPNPLPRRTGTRVVVEALFANVPVRREYVRSPAAEFTRIATFLATLALGYPVVAFQLSHDGRPTFAFRAGATLDERLAHVFGTASPALVRLDSSVAGDARVRGFVSRPGNDRGDRRMQLLFINDRLLRTTQLAGAWSAAYSSYALVGRQPFGVLFIDIPPDHVDPNVHPTKSDVRLRFPEVAHDAVRRTIARTLARDASLRVREALSFAPPRDVEAASAAQPWSEGRSGYALFAAPPYEPAVHANGFAGETFAPVSELRVLAQLDDTFLLATDGRALVLVDQHAAHERIAYEAIARASAGGAPSEPLLVPYTLELDAESYDRFERSRPALAAAGLDAEPFGERCYRIVATPAGYGARAFDVRAYVADLGDEIAGSRCGATRLGVACVPLGRARGRSARTRRDDGAARAPRNVRESDALPARAPDDRTPRARSDRSPLQANVNPSRARRRLIADRSDVFG